MKRYRIYIDEKFLFETNLITTEVLFTVKSSIRLGLDEKLIVKEVN